MTGRVSELSYEMSHSVGNIALNACLDTKILRYGEEGKVIDRVMAALERAYAADA